MEKDYTCIACLGCEVDLNFAEKALADQKQMEECLACGGEGILHSYSGDKKYNCPCMPKTAMMCCVFGRWAHTGKP